MGLAQPFEPEKLIVAMLFTDTKTAQTAETMLIQAFGESDIVSPAYCFSEISPYYDVEMQGKVYRQFYSFAECKDPAQLAAIKTQTNAMEQVLSIEGNRRVNLDPGFIGCGRLSLATTKPAGHRIPLSDGIFAELTLFYARGHWNPFPWTYMDFKLSAVHIFLSQARSRYMQQRKAWIHAEQ